jgi:hypothetical protein
MVACTLPDPPYDYALEPAISGQIQAVRAENLVHVMRPGGIR